MGCLRAKNVHEESPALGRWSDSGTFASLEQPAKMWPWWPWHGLLSASPKLRSCFFHHSRFCLKGISELCISLAAACGPQSTDYTTFCKCLWFCPSIASLGLSSWKMEASGIWLTVACYYGWPQDHTWFSSPPSSAIHSRFPSPSASSSEGLGHVSVLWPKRSFQRGPEWSQPLENKLYST